MKLGLHLNVGLRQTLAPQLIQSLKMLQMPVLKLEQTIRHELATNPLLEELEAVVAENEQATKAMAAAAKMGNLDEDLFNTMQETHNRKMEILHELEKFKLE